MSGSEHGLWTSTSIVVSLLFKVDCAGKFLVLLQLRVGGIGVLFWLAKRLNDGEAFEL